MINLQGGRESGSTNTCSNHISGDVCTDRPGSMGETHYHIRLRPADTGTGIRTGNAQYERSVGDFELGSFFTSHFWYTAGQSAEASSGINWETIVFVAGMMIMVEGMARVGFFRWLCMRLAKMVKYKVVPLFVTFMVLSGILAMFIDSITVILFLAAVTIELSQLLKFNPVPMILEKCSVRIWEDPLPCAEIPLISSLVLPWDIPSRIS